MKCMRLIPRIALLLLVVPVTNAKSQVISDPILGTRTALTTVPDTTIIALTRRVQALETLVAQLQEKLAFIKSVNPLVLDPGGDVSIRANHISLEAGADFKVRASSNTMINSSGAVLIQAGGEFDLKGSFINHNGGSFPVACGASTVNGQTASGGGLRGGEHTHAVTLPVVACSSRVRVPGPGQ